MVFILRQCKIQSVEFYGKFFQGLLHDNKRTNITDSLGRHGNRALGHQRRTQRYVVPRHTAAFGIGITAMRSQHYCAPSAGVDTVIFCVLDAGHCAADYQRSTDHDDRIVNKRL